MLRHLARPGLVPDGFASNAVRYPVAALLYLPILIWGIRSGRSNGFWRLALIPTFINLFGQTLWASAPYHMTPGLQAFMLRFASFWGILGAFIVFRDERQLARDVFFWIGGLLSIVGFSVMSYAGWQGSADTTFTGLVIMFFCSICYGLYGVTVRYAMGGRHPLFVFSVISIYTSIGLLAIAPAGEPAKLIEMDAAPMGILVLSAVLGIAIAHGLYYIAVQRMGVAISSMFLMLTPFVALAGSYLVFEESFSTWQWIGGVVLLVGSALAIRSQQHLPAVPVVAEGRAGAVPASAEAMDQAASAGKAGDDPDPPTDRIDSHLSDS
jgi:drug/metabolite transporter (DMT)-like permease